MIYCFYIISTIDMVTEKMVGKHLECKYNATVRSVYSIHTLISSNVLMSSFFTLHYVIEYLYVFL